MSYPWSVATQCSTTVQKHLVICYCAKNNGALIYWNCSCAIGCARCRHDKLLASSIKSPGRNRDTHCFQRIPQQLCVPELIGLQLVFLYKRPYDRCTLCSSKVSRSSRMGCGRRFHEARPSGHSRATTLACIHSIGMGPI
jgi:hypothetical protein